MDKILVEVIDEEANDENGTEMGNGREMCLGEIYLASLEGQGWGWVELVGGNFAAYKCGGSDERASVRKLV